MPERTAPWTEPVRQRLRAWRAGRLLVDTCRAQLYFPDERHPRWTVPTDDLLSQLSETFHDVHVTDPARKRAPAGAEHARASGAVMIHDSARNLDRTDRR